jgi:hypothetical protein
MWKGQNLGAKVSWKIHSEVKSTHWCPYPSTCIVLNQRHIEQKPCQKMHQSLTRQITTCIRKSNDTTLSFLTLCGNLCDRDTLGRLSAFTLLFMACGRDLQNAILHSFYKRNLNPCVLKSLPARHEHTLVNEILRLFDPDIDDFD